MSSVMPACAWVVEKVQKESCNSVGEQHASDTAFYLMCLAFSDLYIAPSECYQKGTLGCAPSTPACLV